MATPVKDTELSGQLTFEPLSSTNWGKFVELFGVKGACGNCWCMWPRLSKQDFNEGKAEDGNKKAMKDLVWAGEPVGILGFYEDQPIAWCAFAPREHYLKLENSRVHKRIDNEAVWSIPCLFIRKDFRKIGASVELLKGVIQYAKARGIRILEAYPAIPTQEKLPDSFAWIGLYKSFQQAGFFIADRTSKNRPMVRYYTSEPVVVEQRIKASAGKTWKALTDPDSMRKWFFPQITDFLPETGFETLFIVEANGKIYPHRWKITDIIPGEHIVINWKYDGYPGNSFVIFDVTEVDDKAIVKVTNFGIESFPQDNPDFSRASCTAGWTYLIQTRLKEFLEK